MQLDLKVANIFAFTPATLEKNIESVLRCNDFTEPKGLSLNYAQALYLVDTRTNALKSNGRIEFSDSIINKIIYTFSDSAYIDNINYEDTIHDLIELFYYFKNESLDRYNDDQLIAYLYSAFEGYCQGSTELLASKGLEKLLHPETSIEDELEIKISDIQLEAIDELEL